LPAETDPSPIPGAAGDTGTGNTGTGNTGTGNAGTGNAGTGLPPGFRHDLLNAINAINGYAGLLEQVAADDTLKTYARRILQAAAQAQRLCQSLPRSAPVMRPARLLLVAGEADERATGLELALDRLGHQVLRAVTPAEAGEMLAHGAGDLDLVLAAPDLDGREALATTTRATGLGWLMLREEDGAAELDRRLRDHVARRG